MVPFTRVVPSLDVGTRQTNRSDAASVTAVSAFDRAAILGFLTNEWGRPQARDAGFGEGAAADRFVEVLADPAFWDRPLQKAFRD